MNARLPINGFADLLEAEEERVASPENKSEKRLNSLAVRQNLNLNPWGKMGELLISDSGNRALLEERAQGKNKNEVLSLKPQPLPSSVLLTADLNGFSWISDLMTSKEKKSFQNNIQVLAMEVYLKFGVPLLTVPPGDKLEMPIQFQAPLDKTDLERVLAMVTYLHTHPVSLGFSESRLEDLKRQYSDFDARYPHGACTMAMGFEVLEENSAFIGGVVGPEQSRLGNLYIYGPGRDEVEKIQGGAGKRETVVGDRMRKALAEAGIPLPEGSVTSFVLNRDSEASIETLFEDSRRQNIARQEADALTDSNFPMAPYMQLLFSREGFNDLVEVVESFQNGTGKRVDSVVEDTNTLGRSISVLALPEGWKHENTPRFMEDLVTMIAGIEGADLDILKVDGSLVFLGSSLPPKENVNHLMKLSSLLCDSYPDVAMSVGHSNAMARIKAGHEWSLVQDLAGDAIKYAALLAKFASKGEFIMHGPYAQLAGIKAEWTPRALGKKGLTPPVVSHPRSKTLDANQFESRHLFPELEIAECVNRIKSEIEGGRKITALLPELKRAEGRGNAEELLAQRGHGLSALVRRVHREMGDSHEWFDVSDKVELFHNSEYPGTRAILSRLLTKDQTSQLQLDDQELRKWILTQSFFGRTGEPILFVLDDMDPSASDMELIQVLIERSSPETQFLISGLESFRNRNGNECTRVMLPEKNIEAVTDILLQHCLQWSEAERGDLRPFIVQRLKEIEPTLLERFALTPRLASQLFSHLNIRHKPAVECKRLPPDLIVDDIKFDLSNLHVPVGAYAREIEQKLPRDGSERQLLFFVAQFSAALPIRMLESIWEKINPDRPLDGAMEKLHEEGFLLCNVVNGMVTLGRESARNLICAELYTEAGDFLGKVQKEIADYFFEHGAQAEINDENARFYDACLHHVFARRSELARAVPALENLVSFYNRMVRPIDTLRLYRRFAKAYGMEAIPASLALPMARHFMDYGEAQDQALAAKLLKDRPDSEAQFFVFVNRSLNAEKTKNFTEWKQLIGEVHAAIEALPQGDEQRFILECLLLRDWAKLSSQANVPESDRVEKISGQNLQEYGAQLKGRLPMNLERLMPQASPTYLRALRLLGVTLFETPLFNGREENWDVSAHIHKALVARHVEVGTIKTHEGINALHGRAKCAIARPQYIYEYLQNLPKAVTQMPSFIDGLPAHWADSFDLDEAEIALNEFLQTAIHLPRPIYRIQALMQYMNFMVATGIAGTSDERARDIFMKHWVTYERSMPELLRKVPSGAGEHQKIQALHEYLKTLRLKTDLKVLPSAEAGEQQVATAK